MLHEPDYQDLGALSGRDALPELRLGAIAQFSLGNPPWLRVCRQRMELRSCAQPGILAVLYPPSRKRKCGSNKMRQIELGPRGRVPLRRHLEQGRTKQRRRLDSSRDGEARAEGEEVPQGVKPETTWTRARVTMQCGCPEPGSPRAFWMHTCLLFLPECGHQQNK